MHTAQDLIDFETEIAKEFAAATIHSPVHFSGGNEAMLIELFQRIKPEDFVFSTWRSHYHALLHGVPRESVKAEIMAGKSMNLNFPEHRFFSSAIVGGTLSIACGVAAGGIRTWCFIGDMTASIGAFHDAKRFAEGHDLPITFIIEDNGLATNTPTQETWGRRPGWSKTRTYVYERTYPHVGLTERVQF